jgi:hypothetical protein
MAAASRRLAAAAGALALAAALSGCGDPSSGPLGPVEADGYACITQLDHGVLTDGWPFVQNSSTSPAVIDKIGMANSHGLALLGAVAVPTSEDFYGAAPGYPNNIDPLPGFHWAQRRNLIGDSIPRSGGDHKWTDLLFVLRLTASGGHATGVDIWYHVGSQHYHLRTVFGIYVAKCLSGTPSPSAS